MHLKPLGEVLALRCIWQGFGTKILPRFLALRFMQQQLLKVQEKIVVWVKICSSTTSSLHIEKQKQAFHRVFKCYAESLFTSVVLKTHLIFPTDTKSYLGLNLKTPKGSRSFNKMAVFRLGWLCTVYVSCNLKISPNTNLIYPYVHSLSDCLNLNPKLMSYFSVKASPVSSVSPTEQTFTKKKA